MATLYQEEEELIEYYLDTARHVQKGKLREFARDYALPYRRLLNRINDVSTRLGREPTHRALDDAQEATIYEYLNRLDEIGLPATRRLLTSAANSILKRNTDAGEIPKQVGHSWATRFLQRHPEYKIVKGSSQEFKRDRAATKAEVEDWFRRYKKLLARIGVTPRNMYNSDETGNRIGIGKAKSVITRRSNKRKISLPTSTERELVTVLETISADGWAMPPWIILAGKQIPAGWDAANLPPAYTLALSENGYINDQIGLDWIAKFDVYSSLRADGASRLLFMDNHGSHCTMEFVDYADEHGIELFSFPPHMTHLMQPLDVVIFQPYKHYHSEAVDRAARTGCTNFNKVEFLAALPGIRKQSLKATSIQHSFAKTGLWPVNPDMVLRHMRDDIDAELRTPTPDPRDWSLQTPKTVRSMRRLGLALLDVPTDQMGTPQFYNSLEKFVMGGFQASEQASAHRDELIEHMTIAGARDKRQNIAGNGRVIQKGGYLTAGKLRRAVRQRDEGTQPLTEWERKCTQAEVRPFTELSWVVERPDKP